MKKQDFEKLKSEVLDLVSGGYQKFRPRTV